MQIFSREAHAWLPTTLYLETSMRSLNLAHPRSSRFSHLCRSVLLRSSDILHKKQSFLERHSHRQLQLLENVPLVYLLLCCSCGCAVCHLSNNHKPQHGCNSRCYRSFRLPCSWCNPVRTFGNIDSMLLIESTGSAWPAQRSTR